MILDELTWGSDVGSKAEVHQMIDELARDGLAIILISSDPPEVLAISDRILVMREGQADDDPRPGRGRRLNSS